MECFRGCTSKNGTKILNKTVSLSRFNGFCMFLSPKTVLYVNDNNNLQINLFPFLDLILRSPSSILHTSSVPKPSTDHSFMFSRSEAAKRNIVVACTLVRSILNRIVINACTWIT